MVKTQAQEGKRARITLVLPAQMLERVKELAEERATPPSILIRQWIAEKIKQEREQGR